jgi:hypothetical protein
VLIFGWGTGHPMGVAGAALASFVAIVLGVLALAVYVIRSESYLAFVARDCKPRLALWARMLKIGLPAGAEFGLMGVYLFIVYSVSRPFGAAAQGRLRHRAAGGAGGLPAGGGDGLRGQPGGRPELRRAAARARARDLQGGRADGRGPDGDLHRPLPPLSEAMIRVFSRDPQVLAVGGEYLRIISFNYVASGIVFVTGSMFQAMGNTIPSLLSSIVRITLLAIPVYLLARLPGFQLRWIWYLSVASVLMQMVSNLLLLRREFRRRLSFPATAPPARRRSSVPAGAPLRTWSAGPCRRTRRCRSRRWSPCRRPCGS